MSAHHVMAPPAAIWGRVVCRRYFAGRFMLQCCLRHISATAWSFISVQRARRPRSYLKPYRSCHEASGIVRSSEDSISILISLRPFPESYRSTSAMTTICILSIDTPPDRLLSARELFLLSWLRSEIFGDFASYARHRKLTASHHSEDDTRLPRQMSMPMPSLASLFTARAALSIMVRRFSAAVRRYTSFLDFLLAPLDSGFF